MPVSPTQTSPLNLSNQCQSYKASTQCRSLNSLALNLLRDYGLEELEGERLAVVVNAALEVKHLLFLAALDDPTASELESIAEDFIQRALTSGRNIQ
jgi:hypothetical protein